MLKQSAIVKRSIVLLGHKTSVSLEDEFWEGLKEIAGGGVDNKHPRLALGELVARIDEDRDRTNLSSALRLVVLAYYKSQIPEGLPSHAPHARALDGAAAVRSTPPSEPRRDSARDAVTT